MMRRLLPVRRQNLPESRSGTRSPMDMFDMFEDMFRSPARGFEEFGSEFVPTVEVSEKENEIIVRAEMPGLNPEDIAIQVENNNLILSGEKKREEKDEKENYVHMECSYGRFYRAIPLRGDVDPEKIKAKFKNGVLTVNVPLAEGAKPRKISIES